MEKTEFELVVLKSAEVFKGTFRKVKIGKTLIECEFQPSFSIRCHSKYRKCVLIRENIKSSTMKGFMLFNWNSQCKCGFKAKNNRGLKVHKRTCYTQKKELKAPKNTIKKTNTRINTPMVKVLNSNLRRKTERKPNTIELNTKIRSFDGKNKLNNTRELSLKECRNRIRS